MFRRARPVAHQTPRTLAIPAVARWQASGITTQARSQTRPLIRIWRGKLPLQPVTLVIPRRRATAMRSTSSSRPPEPIPITTKPVASAPGIALTVLLRMVISPSLTCPIFWTLAPVAARSSSTPAQSARLMVLALSRVMSTPRPSPIRTPTAGGQTPPPARKTATSAPGSALARELPPT